MCVFWKELSKLCRWLYIVSVNVRTLCVSPWRPKVPSAPRCATKGWQNSTGRARLENRLAGYTPAMFQHLWTVNQRTRFSVPVKKLSPGSQRLCALCTVCAIEWRASSLTDRSFWDLLSLIFQSSSSQCASYWHSRRGEETACRHTRTLPGRFQYDKPPLLVSNNKWKVIWRKRGRGLFLLLLLLLVGMMDKASWGMQGLFLIVASDSGEL